MSIAGVPMIRARADFLKARNGRRLNGPHFFVETRCRGDDDAPRLGLTVTRKIGNAVVRNRIKRRLRDAVRLKARHEMVAGIDYVIVARRDVATLSFDALKDELSRRFSRLNESAQEPSRTKRRPHGRPSGSN